MKICFITTGNINNIATSKRALGMANPLVSMGWDVHIIMENVEGNKQRAKDECNQKVQMHYFNAKSAYEEVKEKNKIIKRIKPDYIYVCAFVFRNLVALYNKRIIKLVEHSELQSAIPDIKGLKRLVVKILEMFSILYSNGLLCASKFLEEFYIKGGKKMFKKLPILHFPYAYSTALYKVKEDNALPEKFLKFKDKKNFVFLGTITKNYGVFTMIHAFQELLKTQSDIRLVLLGKGRHYQEAFDYVSKNNLEDYVYMPGFIKEEDVSNYFSIAFSFISPMNDTIQDWARCPSKLYMYLPFKKPIFTCKIGEPFYALGGHGYYFSPGSAESLSNSIQQYLTLNNKDKFVNPELHTWENRSKEFDIWIRKTFVK